MYVYHGSGSTSDKNVDPDPHKVKQILTLDINSARLYLIRLSVSLYGSIHHWMHNWAPFTWFNQECMLIWIICFYFSLVTVICLYKLSHFIFGSIKSVLHQKWGCTMLGHVEDISNLHDLFWGQHTIMTGRADSS